MIRREVEILAPAGSIDSLYASLRMGADAVYVGTNRFGARAFADNPSVEELREALVYAHLRNKKIYLTTNTLIEQNDMSDLYDVVLPLYEAGLDACIVQDVGALSFLHENFPGMDLHASTQMTLFSGEEAELYRSFGVTRYVPARELTIEEIRNARKQTGMEIEVFVHGALCYCYSGQCLMSEVIGGRSGNKGMCAQPCRLAFSGPYGKGHFLSTKDICTLPYIPELVDAGIDSFKIEGRMKRKEYSAYVSYMYRKYVDFYLENGNKAYAEYVENPDSPLWKDYKQCMELYNRGGFSKSFLFEKNKSDMIEPKKNGHAGLLVGKVIKVTNGKVHFEIDEPIQYQDVLEFRNSDGSKEYEYTVKMPSNRGEIVVANYQRGCQLYRGQQVYRTKNTSLLQHISEKIEHTKDTIFLKGTWIASEGQPITFTVEGNGVKAEIQGTVLQKAKSRPVTKDDVKEKLEAMGNTKYDWQELQVKHEKDSFVPVGEIKRLRREAIAAWEQQAVLKRTIEQPMKLLSAKENVRLPMTLIGVSGIEQLQLVKQAKAENLIIHLRLNDWKEADFELLPEQLKGYPVAISLPRVLRGRGYQNWLNKWERLESYLKQLSVSIVLINSHRSLLFARKYFPKATYFADENMYQKNEAAVLAYQSLGICKGIPKNYGRVEVMVTEGCMKATTKQCGKKKEYVTIRTPKKDSFVVVNHCDVCYNTIYTTDAISTKRTGEDLRLEFTWEKEEEVRKVLGEWNLL